MAWGHNPFDTSDHLLRQGEASRGAAVVASSGNLAAGRIQRVDGRLSAWVGTSGWRLFWAGSTIVAIALTAAGVVYVAKEQIIDALLGENPLGTGADISGLGPSTAPPHPVPEVPQPVPAPGDAPAPAVPEKPEPFDPGPKPGVAAEVPATESKPTEPERAPEAPAQPATHHVSKESYDLAANNLSTIADHAPIENPTDQQISDLQSAMRARGFDISADDARQALKMGAFEARGATYEIWHSKYDPSHFVATEVDASHALNGHAQHIDTAPLPPDAAPAEFSDAEKAQYQKFTEGSAGDSTFHPSPDHYQEAALSRDGTFGGADGMRDAAHILNGYTAEEIRTHEPPAGASPEVVHAWHQMQGWLNGEAAHLPYPPQGTHLSAYLLSIGMIG